MKFLISDYDGTLKSDVKNLKINISAIQKFRNNGNLFAIATGRSYESIKEEIKKYDINYDYLITNDGAITFDKFDNIINYEVCKENELEELYSSINNLKNYKNRIEQFKLPNSSVTVELQILTTIFKKSNDIDHILKNYPNIEKAQIKIFLFKLTFLKKYCNKSTAIKKLIETIDNCGEIITIGDGYNDIEMLKDFNGYKMLSCYPCLWKYKFKITKEVHMLIKKL